MIEEKNRPVASSSVFRAEPLRLHDQALPRLPKTVRRPAYDRTKIRPGIVHIGPGNFHRAHQAAYADDLLHLPGTEAWGIWTVNLRSVSRELQTLWRAQNGLYTLVERRDESLSARVLGPHVGHTFALESPSTVLDVLSSSTTRLVTLTITEGGYGVDDATGRFRDTDPQILRDLAHPETPGTVFGYLAAALDRRRVSGLPPFTILSCDNLQKNGRIMRTALLAFAERRDPALARYIETHGAFPSSMVDRITPATRPEDVDMLRTHLGIDDIWPVTAEPFRQWVIEDWFVGERPPLEEVGVQFTGEVEPYELIKLRVLNAGHSALGYLAHLAGIETIHEAARHPALAQFLGRFLDGEVTPLLPPVAGVCLEDYKCTVVSRFSNAAVADPTSRICMDGSAKMPKFVLPSIREQLLRGGPIRCGALVVAAWFRYLTGIDDQGREFSVVDQMADRLTLLARSGRADPRPLLGLTEIFGDLGREPRLVGEVELALASLHENGAVKTLRAWLEPGLSG